MTALLTWYIHTQRTNPFIPRQRLRILGAPGALILQATGISSPSAGRATLVVADSSIRFPQPDRLDEPGNLITAGSPHDMQSLFAAPPAQWLALRPDHNAPAPPHQAPDWPPPQPAMRTNEDDGLGVRTLETSAGVIGLAISRGNASILLWRPERTVPDSATLHRYREQFDMLICIDCAPGAIHALRDALRPRLAVALANEPPDSLPGRPGNVVLLHPGAPALELKPLLHGGFEMVQ